MQPFIVDFIGLARGTSVSEWKADREFFARFDNQDIIDADVDVVATVVNHGVTVDVSCLITGTVTVPCDRCLDDLEVGIETSFEETYVPDGDALDVSQDVYDYVCTAIPLRRVHEEGFCNEETVKYWSK